MRPLIRLMTYVSALRLAGRKALRGSQAGRSVFVLMAVVAACSLIALGTACVLSSCGGGGSSGSTGTTPATATATVTLAWDPVSDPNLSGYRIYYGNTSGNYLQSRGQGTAVGNVTSYTVSGLSGGTRYYFAVTAFNTSGDESPLSNEVFKDIP